ncbi:hypothetical protein D3C76_1212430 [compost metagenome]
MLQLVVIVMDHPYGNQDIIRLGHPGVDILLGIADCSVARHSRLDIGFHIGPDFFLDPGQQLLAGKAVFVCTVPGQVWCFEAFELVVGKRLQPVHKPVVHFLRSIQRNPVVVQPDSSVHAEVLGFRNPVFSLHIGSHLGGLGPGFNMVIEAIQPKRHVGACNILDPVRRHEPLGSQPPVAAPFLEGPHRFILADGKGQHLHRPELARQPVPQDGAGAAEAAQRGGGFRIGFY